MNWIDRHMRIGKTHAVLRELYCSVVTERELPINAKLSVFVRILIYEHASWVMTETVLSQAQTAEMGFLRNVHGVTLRDKVPSCEIRKTLNVKPLLFWVERSQVWCYSHVSRMPQDIFARRVLLATPTGKRSSKDQMVWSDLRLGLVSSWYGADRTIGNFWKTWRCFGSSKGCCPATLPRRKVIFILNDGSCHLDRETKCFVTSDGLTHRPWPSVPRFWGPVQLLPMTTHY